MDRLLIVNGRIALENEWLNNGFIYIEGTAIKEIGTMDQLPNLDEQARIIDLSAGYTAVPGFIDVHIHGAGGADTMDATPDALTTIAATLPAEGTTSFLATTITQEKTAIKKALENAAQYSTTQNKPGKAEMLGIHLEGPFINKIRAGAQPEEYIIDPDIDLFRDWQQAAENQIKLVTVAPELANGLDFIHYLHETDVIASIGHSDANYEVMAKAAGAGARHVTHLFNGMRGLHHREPGTAGAALLLNELKIELIADGIHVRPEMVKLVLNAKGKDGIILITDAMRAKCLKNGEYDLGGQTVKVADGKALLADGTLAGSILKMNNAVKNVNEFTNAPLLDVITLASANPAKQLNMFDRKGSIAPGKDADIVILDEQLRVIITLCRGQIAYGKEVFDKQ
ncbi:N-acetylglucosamine-6-phosphate deacetylase [Bacillus sp. V33-4]|uniref:N-acetylglucosamine-6-phosphate deacetylase n=1 Tax=Bacillus sp. V33-4 TaxID=2054169 RepID=UPI000C792BAD|nr:N-acetylglucosamine-6-phosphate deacetylase [Bacillus sp. V33-4]PLR87885.1 N-acetylglucosamine-6-phosphate deacetylase [Bacillus sp. V33-4]